MGIYAGIIGTILLLIIVLVVDYLSKLPNKNKRNEKRNNFNIQ